MKRSLTRSQASELWRAASLLPLATRDAFLNAVDARLCSLPHRLNDGDVQSAIVTTLSTFNISISSHLMCDAQPKETTMAKSPYVHENLPDDDDVLRDGETRRVPMMMRDGVGFTDSLAQHRPGQRFSTDQAANDARQRAYEESVRELQDAWKNPPGVRGQQPGDQCTIDGQPGHLDHRLQCVPDKPERQDAAVPRSMTADAAQKIKDEAWLQSVKDLEQAWRQ